MAYRFSGSGNDRVKFAVSPFTGYTFGAGTFAAFIKRSSSGLSVANFFLELTDSADSHKALFYFGNDDTIRILLGSNVTDGTVNNTTNWLIVAVSFPNGGTARFHVYNGTSWTHTNVSAVSSASIVSTDKLMFGANDSPSNGFSGDAVCCGIKKADSTDAQIETLTATAFQSWRNFGFDWLIGFDASQETAGILQDQATPGTGDEIAISGTTVVADPAGWAWVSAVTPVADFTGTPLTGLWPLSVAFTDTSTNTPTSWAWTFGDGGTSSSQNPTHSYAAAGTYTVTLVATNSAGSNTKTRTGYVTVSNPSGTFTKIQWGDHLKVTDVGGGVIRVDYV